MENEPSQEQLTDFKVGGIMFLGSLALEGVALGLGASGIAPPYPELLALGGVYPLVRYSRMIARSFNDSYYQ
ncbi:MAG TPA: hypothetical protein VMR34_03590 [Candidatus Saccharimonadales bacterium]|nr:hypothetical protein [Candidatus Saccharimonadales bacterium]